MISALRPSESEALAEWTRLIEADREQVERLREDQREDYYAPVARSFDPRHRESAEWPVVISFAEPGDTWLDIGAGGGRFAVPLAGVVDRVIAVEPSESMRAVLAEAIQESGCTNIEVHETPWPIDGWGEEVDVSLAAHALYDTANLATWLNEQERTTRRTCLAVFGSHARGTQVADLFEAVHGEPMATLPALREFVAVLGARGVRYDVHSIPTGEAPEPRPPAEAYQRLRRLLWLDEGSPLDEKMRTLADRWYGVDGGLVLPVMRPWIGVVAWSPR